jgi:hypothetical protein
MKNTPFVLIATALIGLVSLLVLPWVSTDAGSLTLVDILRTKGHGHQVAYFILAPLALAIIVGGLSVKLSRRWQTGLVALFLVIPTLLSAVVKHGGVGARIALVGSALALISAIALTVKPKRVEI